MIENPEEGFYYFYSLADTVFQKNEIPSFSSFGITEEEIKEKSLNFMGEAKITSSPKK